MENISHAMLQSKREVINECKHVDRTDVLHSVYYQSSDYVNKKCAGQNMSSLGTRLHWKTPSNHPSIPCFEIEVDLSCSREDKLQFFSIIFI